MICDPDEPGYRYPKPGERYWHVPWNLLVEIADPCDPPWGPSEDEVMARGVVDGQMYGVKLRSLETAPEA